MRDEQTGPEPVGLPIARRRQVELTDDPIDPPARRRRLRQPRPDRGGGPSTMPADSTAVRQVRVPSAAAPEDREADRGLRSLIGAGSSQLSVSAALRARDAARPTEVDLAEAEERVVLIRRNWTPPEH
ncbi:MAG TPA: hypothetical protein VF174_01375 [Micromonosporaceae bacterium]